MDQNKKQIFTIVFLTLLILVSVAFLVFLFLRKPAEQKNSNNNIQSLNQPIREKTFKPTPAQETLIVYEKEAADPNVPQEEIIGSFVSFDDDNQKITLEANEQKTSFNCPQNDCSKVEYLKSAGDDMTAPAKMGDLKPGNKINVRFKKENQTVLFVLIR